MEAIRIGILGAGIFARQHHLPALLHLPEQFQVVAVCSRSEASTDAFNALLREPVPAYHEMQAFLQHPGMEAVDAVLPINLLPVAVERTLKAGKHLLSEKPIAPNVDYGQILRRLHEREHADLVWMVAENWRYSATIQGAKALLAEGAIGEPLLAHWAIHVQMDDDNPYFNTAWRKTPDYQGGFLLDGGVHHVAALRTLFGDVKRVSAFTRLIREDLPPADTLAATLEFESGMLATYAVTYAGRAPQDTTLNIVGKQGAMHVNRDELRVVPLAGEAKTHTYNDGNGIRGELEAFAAAIRSKSPHLNTPLETLKDLAVLEALLDSAEAGISVLPKV